MEPWLQIILTILGSVVASSGFWAYIQSRRDKNDARSRMLVGLGHDRIVELGLTYIERGWITQEEYENLNDYLYKPYTDLGGNGSAKKIMSEVDRLPMHASHFNKEEL